MANGKYRKTLYINQSDKDVLQFFNRKNPSQFICALIREQLKKERGEVNNLDLSIQDMIRDIHAQITTNRDYN